MEILVDADACPKPIKEIIFRAAKRLSITTTLFANHDMAIPPSPYIKKVRVMGGFDVADQIIIDKVQAADLVITADIPLAAAVVEKGAHALNPRGELYTQANVQDRLAMRNLMDGLRQVGQVSGGPAPLNQRDLMAFANAFDSFLAKRNSSK